MAAWVVLAAAPAWAQGYVARTLDKPVPGGVAVVPLGESESAPVVEYAGKRLLVMKDSDQQWVALAGIDLKTKPGSKSLAVTVTGQRRSVAFDVGSKRYKEQHIKLKNKSYVNPDPAQQARFAREYKAQINAYNNFRADLPSNVMLDRPVDGGRLSSPFGLRRFFNGEERNPHSGLDFAVPKGTPVKAPADGVVTIVDDYFFNGKTVFLDHGQGLITMYCHLSEADVQVGQVVKRGEVIAKVGSTGRATGPHLHWNVSMNGNRIDPAIFIGAFEPWAIEPIGRRRRFPRRPSPCMLALNEPPAAYPLTRTIFCTSGTCRMARIT